MNATNGKRTWRDDLSSLLLRLTLIYFVVSVATSIWFAVSLRGAQILISILAGASIAGMGLLGANLLLAFIPQGRRATHIALVALLLASFALDWWGSGLHRDNRRRSFIHQERFAYEGMVQRVMANRTLLRDKPRALNSLVDRPHGASARTNADGSVTILFPGGEAGPRHGYLYHSGGLPSGMPGDPEAHFVHLTNGWYEY